MSRRDHEQRVKGLLSDLGRPTMRGVRRCPRCGTLNGLRGRACKNRACSERFREKRPLAKTTCELDMGRQHIRVFSVRDRDCEAEVRGFVQMPMTTAWMMTASAETKLGARCHFPACQRTDTVDGSDDVVNSDGVRHVCRHISKARCCNMHSTPLPVLKSSVTRFSRLSAMLRQQFLALIDQHEGGGGGLPPLVQRVSASCFVVHCPSFGDDDSSPIAPHPHQLVRHVVCRPDRADRKHRRSADADMMDGTGAVAATHLCYCTCSVFKASTSGRCMHVYACLCAFLSCKSLQQEFSRLLALECVLEPRPNDDAECNELDMLNGLIEYDSSLTSCHSVCLPSSSHYSSPLSSSTLSSSSATLSSQLHQQDQRRNFLSDDAIEELREDSVLQVIQLSDCALPECAELTTAGAIASADSLHAGQMALQLADGHSDLCVAATVAPPQPTTATVLTTKRLPAIQPAMSSMRPFTGGDIAHEASLWLSFHEWLGTITETINTTMHYQHSGRPAPLVFRAPRAFFSALKERIAHGVKKRRLANTATTVRRTLAPPVGEFVKYAWHINNVIHLKWIFDGPSILLDVTRSFDYCSRTNSYCPSFPPAVSPHPSLCRNTDGSYPSSVMTAGQAPIVPQHYRTVLKVGCMTPQQREPTPFIIEWIPDLLPMSGVGELSLHFEFVHQRNGVLVAPPTAHDGDCGATNGRHNN